MHATFAVDEASASAVEECKEAAEPSQCSSAVDADVPTNWMSATRAVADIQFLLHEMQRVAKTPGAASSRWAELTACIQSDNDAARQHVDEAYTGALVRIAS